MDELLILDLCDTLIVYETHSRARGIGALSLCALFSRSPVHHRPVGVPLSYLFLARSLAPFGFSSPLCTQRRCCSFFRVTSYRRRVNAIKMREMSARTNKIAAAALHTRSVRVCMYSFPHDDGNYKSSPLIAFTILVYDSP